MTLTDDHWDAYENERKLNRGRQMSERATERDRQCRDLEEVQADLREWSDEQVADGLDRGKLPWDVTRENVAAEAARRLRAASDRGGDYELPATEEPSILTGDLARTMDNLRHNIGLIEEVTPSIKHRLESGVRSLERVLERLRAASTDAPEERAIEAVVSDARWLVDTARKTRGRGMDDIWDGIEDLRESLDWLDRSEPAHERER